VTGQLATVTLGTNGKVTQSSAILNGAASGNDFVLSASTFGLQTIALSGSLAGDRLTLTGGAPGTLLLVRSDLKEYQKEVAALQAKSHQMLVAKAAEAARLDSQQSTEKYTSEVDRVIEQMHQFISVGDMHLRRFPGAEEQLHAITAKMNEYVNRERQLAGNPDAGVARSQLVVAANQASLVTNQAGISIDALRSSLAVNVQPIIVHLTNLEQACRGKNPPGVFTAEQNAALNAACDRLFRADGPYRQKLEAVTRGLAEVEELYAKERKAQDRLLLTAQQLQ